MINTPKKRINKVMLMTPRYTLSKNDVRRCVTPIGLASIAAYLEKEGYNIRVLDIANEGYNNTIEEGNFVTYGLSDKEIRGKIEEFDPDIVGVSCIFSAQAENVKNTLKLVKDTNKDITTLTGGSHPTYASKDMLDSNYLDFVIMGEGELPTSQLLTALNNGEDISKIKGLAGKINGHRFTNTKKQYIKNLDDLPFPARHLLNMEQYFKINLPQNPYPKGKRVTQITTSRGCSAKCVFCTTTNFWGNHYRGRSSKNVVEEIKEMKEKYDINEFQITDDNFTLNKKRVIEILKKIKNFDLKWCTPQGIAVWALDYKLLDLMKESGCYQLTFAIESGNQQVLDEIIKKPLRLEKVKPLVKKAQELGMSVHSFAVCGLPGETKDNMQETYDFIENCGFDSASFFVATPLIGSELLETCKRKNYLKEDITYNNQLFKLGNISTPEFRAEDIQKLVARFNKRYNGEDIRKKRFENGKY